MELKKPCRVPSDFEEEKIHVQRLNKTQKNKFISLDTEIYISLKYKCLQ